MIELFEMEQREFLVFAGMYLFLLVVVWKLWYNSAEFENPIFSPFIFKLILSFILLPVTFVIVKMINNR